MYSYTSPIKIFLIEGYFPHFSPDLGKNQKNGNTDSLVYRVIDYLYNGIKDLKRRMLRSKVLLVWCFSPLCSFFPGFGEKRRVDLVTSRRIAVVN